MSWSELERLVYQAEANPSLRRSLKGCRSTPELILAVRRLGYRITRMDLQRAREEEREEYQREAQG
jgi:DNA-binding winged helix-turn-helix (wHTH) protein